MDPDALDNTLALLERSLLEAQAAYRRRAEGPPQTAEVRQAEDTRLRGAIGDAGASLLNLLQPLDGGWLLGSGWPLPSVAGRPGVPDAAALPLADLARRLLRWPFWPGRAELAGPYAAEVLIVLRQVRPLVAPAQYQDGLDPLPRRLLLHMRGREEDDLASICPAVWGEDFDNISEQAIHTAVSKVNRHLGQRQARRVLSKPRDQSVIRWVARGER
jgi:hypothetical protein